MCSEHIPETDVSSNSLEMTKFSWNKDENALWRHSHFWMYGILLFFKAKCIKEARFAKEMGVLTNTPLLDFEAGTTTSTDIVDEFFEDSLQLAVKSISEKRGSTTKNPNGIKEEQKGGKLASWNKIFSAFVSEKNNSEETNFKRRKIVEFKNEFRRFLFETHSQEITNSLLEGIGAGGGLDVLRSGINACERHLKSSTKTQSPEKERIFLFGNGKTEYSALLFDLAQENIEGWIIGFQDSFRETERMQNENTNKRVCHSREKCACYSAALECMYERLVNDIFCKDVCRDINAASMRRMRFCLDTYIAFRNFKILSEGEINDVEAYNWLDSYDAFRMSHETNSSSEEKIGYRLYGCIYHPLHKYARKNLVGVRRYYD